MMLMAGIVVPLSVIIGLFSYVIITESSAQEERQITETLERIELNLTGIIKVAESFSLSYFADERFNELIRPLSNVDNVEESYDIQTELVHKIDKDLFSYDLFSDFVIYHYDSNKSLGASVEHIKLVEDELFNETWYRRYIDLEKDLQIMAMDEISYTSVIVVRRLNFYDYDSSLFSVLKINPKRIEDILKDNVLYDKGIVVRLEDSEGNVLGASNTNIAASDKQMTIQFDYLDVINDWSLTAYYNNEMISTNIVYDLMWLVVSIILVLFVGLFSVYIIGHAMSSRMQYISMSMDLKENDELSQIEVEDSDDEIGYVAKRYNYLVKKIHKLIYEDSITGMQNRTAFVNKIDSMYGQLDERGAFSLVIIDIDDFKYINDTFGHDVGDSVVIELGKRFVSAFSRTFEVGRFGGDEFIILVDDSSMEVLDSISSKIQNLLELPIIVENHSFYITASVGVSVAPKDGHDRKELLKSTELALYKAKDSGKNRMIIYNESMLESLEKKLTMYRAIRIALSNNEFFLNYQPIYDMNTREIVSLEALIRWNSSELGFVSPYELITSAEESGAIIQIGEWVLKEAIASIKQIAERYDIPIQVSINISALQLRDPMFKTNLNRIVDEIGLSISRVALEITETVFLGVNKKNKEILQSLAQEGFEISLDDFGTGYSSLSYFDELEFSKLKIDKSFIDKLLTSENTFMLVETIIALAHNKGVKVIAEGVEEEVQFEALKSINCDMVQGYYLSKPLSRDAIEDLIEKYFK